MKVNPFLKIFRNDKYQNPYDYPLAGFPHILDIEVTNICNLDCVMCSRSIMTRKRGMIDFDVFKKVIDEAADFKAGIRFIRFGEPFLHKEIFRMIDYVKAKKLICHATTNGILHTEESLKKIVDSGLDSIIFSFQGTDKNEYELMRNNNQYDRLKENICYLRQYRDSRGSDTPFIQVSTSILDEGERELERFISQWNQIADRVDYWYTSLVRVKHLPRVKKLLNRQTLHEKLNNSPCKEVMVKLSVNWNGDITACCSDFNGALVLGNVKDSSLKDIWLCKKLNMYREVLKRGERYKIPFCSLCFDDAQTRPDGKEL